SSGRRLIRRVATCRTDHCQDHEPREPHDDLPLHLASPFARRPTNVLPQVLRATPPAWLRSSPASKTLDRTHTWTGKDHDQRPARGPVGARRKIQMSHATWLTTRAPIGIPAAARPDQNAPATDAAPISVAFPEATWAPPYAPAARAAPAHRPLVRWIRR